MHLYKEETLTCVSRMGWTNDYFYKLILMNQFIHLQARFTCLYAQLSLSTTHSDIRFSF